MKALSIRQPWAWLIVRPDLTSEQRAAAIQRGEIKDIENRTWPTRLRGRFLVHAAKGMTRREYEGVELFLLFSPVVPAITLPAFEELARGGIIGSIELVDCVTHSHSPWFMGPYGFVLRDPQPLPFQPLKGALGFFEVPK